MLMQEQEKPLSPQNQMNYLDYLQQDREYKAAKNHW